MKNIYLVLILINFLPLTAMQKKVPLLRRQEKEAIVFYPKACVINIQDQVKVQAIAAEINCPITFAINRNDGKGLLVRAQSVAVLLQALYEAHITFTRISEQ